MRVWSSGDLSLAILEGKRNILLMGLAGRISQGAQKVVRDKILICSSKSQLNFCDHCKLRSTEFTTMFISIFERWLIYICVCLKMLPFESAFDYLSILALLLKCPGLGYSGHLAVLIASWFCFAFSWAGNVPRRARRTKDLPNPIEMRSVTGVAGAQETRSAEGKC